MNGKRGRSWKVRRVVTTPSSYPSIRTDSAEVQVREECRTCHGSGEQPWGRSMACRQCAGMGKTTRWVSLADLLAALSQLQDALMDEAMEEDEASDDE